jgi:hypothetical protein
LGIVWSAPVDLDGIPLKGSIIRTLSSISESILPANGLAGLADIALVRSSALNL